MRNKNFSIPVLMYHHVNPEGSFINVKPGTFESHIRFLKERGFTALHTYELLSIMKGERPCPPKPVMITFDDGWLDNWVFAYPVLKKYRMKAVIFMVTSLVSEQGRRKRADEGDIKALPRHKQCQKMVDENNSDDVMLSWDEIIEMEKSGLVEFEPHTHTHQRWDRMHDNSEALRNVLQQELDTSKNIIEQRLNKKSRSLCWPWGIYTDEYLDIAKSAGFDLLFTTEKGTNTADTDPLRIRRIVIGDINAFTFRKKIFIHSRAWLSRAYMRFK